MKKFKLFLLLVPFLFFFSFVDDTDTDITVKDVTSHVKYLSGDELEGRFPGTNGDKLAQEYIIEKFKKAGLKPAGTDGFRQPLDFVAEIKLQDGNAFTVTANGNSSSYTVKEDFTPIGLSSIGEVSGDLVFVGYGITSDDPKYDDLANIDVRDKIAVALRYSPGFSDPHNNPFARYEQTRAKLENLIRAGAKGVIFVTGPASEDEDDLPRLRVDNSTMENKVPVIHVKRNAVENLFSAAGKDLKTVQEAINSSKTPNSFPLNAAASFKSNFANIRANTANIIGYLEGSDPELKKEVIVIGAHMDHLGDGMKYGSLNQNHSAEIHNGADDNASGTAGVMELAEKMSAEQKKNKTFKRSYLFMLFAGEEAGLIGSAYFTNSSLFDKYDIVSMVNMDMIGRLQNNRLIINGVGTSASWDEMLEKNNKDFNFSLAKQQEGFGSSDYSSFYSKNVPVLGFFTGLHSDYHKPSDDWDKIDAESEVKILKYVYAVVKDMDKMPVKPDFVKTKMENQQSMTGFRVTLGVVPDYGETSDGMKIVGVRPGGPAETAGIMAEDIIVKMGNTDIKNVYDYTFALGKFKQGDETEVVVKRGSEIITYKITFKK